MIRRTKSPFDCTHRFITPTITDPAPYGMTYPTGEPRCERCGYTMSELYEEAIHVDDDRGLDIDYDHDQVGYHIGCRGIVRERVYPGHRPYMARFAEPDEVIWTCECGAEVDEDEVTSNEEDTPDEG